MRYFEPIKPKRSTMRALRRRPFLHEQATVPVWACLVILLGIVEDYVDHPVLSLLSWAIMIAAIVQWFWWGRRP